MTTFDILSRDPPLALPLVESTAARVVANDLEVFRVGGRASRPYGQPREGMRGESVASHLTGHDGVYVGIIRKTDQVITCGTHPSNLDETHSTRSSDSLAQGDMCREIVGFSSSGWHGRCDAMSFGGRRDACL